MPKITATTRSLMSAADFLPLQRRSNIIPTRRRWYSRLWRDLYARYLRWCERSVVEERESCQDAEITMGPEYIRNSYRQEELLRLRIADLENS
jgi:hypothetical protein